MQVLSDNNTMKFLRGGARGRSIGAVKSISAAQIIAARFIAARIVAIAALWSALAVLPAYSAVTAPPLLGRASADSRQAVIKAAEAFLGAPYRLGGETKSGIDCSGLVYAAFLKATGIKVPRTVRDLSKWVLVIPRQDLVPGDLVFFDLEASATATSVPSQTSVPQNAAFLSKADHVGIYIGEGIFIHAASSGSPKGVIKSSLSEAGWKHRFLFAGRALPASALSGIAAEWGGGVGLGHLDSLLSSPFVSLRSFNGWGELSLPIANNFAAGIRLGIAWDRYLGVVRVPAELDIGQISGFSLFAGPALTFGSSVHVIATGGIRWSPLLFSSGAQRFGIYAELRYDHYVPLAGQPDNAIADMNACVSFSIGFRLRSVKY